MGNHSCLINMKELAFRLKESDDLKTEIERHVFEAGYTSGCILSGVGCVKKINIRLAKAVNCLEKEQDYEIISLTGTISKDGSHIHIGLADELGNAIGGHLKVGTIINTTCEIVIGIMEEYEFSRVFDVNTGYDELTIKKK